MRVKLGLEMWLVDGELVLPWIKFQDGTGARGLAQPTPVVVEKGSEVVLVTDTWREHEWESDRELLEATPCESMGHDPELAAVERGGMEPRDECACGCKGCNTGEHCNDARCFPLHD